MNNLLYRIRLVIETAFLAFLPRAEGLSWYDRARADCERIARETGFDAVNVIHALSTLSPALEWSQNLRLTRDLAESLITGRPVRKTPVYPQFLAKAGRILRNGEPASGPKVSAFARAIAGDHDAVAIDRHMLRAIGWHSISVTPYLYAVLAESWRTEASKAGLSPRDSQAVVWTYQRGSEVAQQVVHIQSRQGGSTVDTRTGPVREGYAVARPTGSLYTERLDVRDIDEFVTDHGIVGTWRDGRFVELAHVDVFANRSDAIAAGIDRNQTSIYDLARDEEIPVRIRRIS